MATVTGDNPHLDTTLPEDNTPYRKQPLGENPPSYHIRTVDVLYQVSSKSDDFSLRYGDLTIFKMAAVRHLGF